MYRKIFLSLLLLAVNSPLAKGENARDPLSVHNSCAAYIHKYEHMYRIPHGLLQAISKAESGRKDHTGQIVAWPWTINVGGKGYFFPTKKAAVAAVQALQQKGVKSIDIGCMQVNLYYHPKAFKNLEDGFEPLHNVAYAAYFLTSLHREHKCWYRAVAHYHSANPLYHIPYQKTVLAIWKGKDRPFSQGLVQQTFSPTEGHIRRLTRGKTLKLPTLTPVSERSSARRRQGEPSCRIHRLKLSSN